MFLVECILTEGFLGSCDPAGALLLGVAGTSIATAVFGTSTTFTQVPWVATNEAAHKLIDSHIERSDRQSVVVLLFFRFEALVCCIFYLGFWCVAFFKKNEVFIQ